jgi:hypothetical protein
LTSLATFGVLAGGLVFAGAPALAGGVAPTVEGLTAPVANVTPFAARLEAVVDPENETTTECRFFYGVSVTEETGEVSCEPGEALTGEAQSVSLNLPGLAPGTKYYYKLVVASAGGEVEAAGELTTLVALVPTIEGETASALVQSTATLSAQVATDSENTTCQFQYVSEAEFQEAGYATAAVVPCEPPEFAEGSGVAPLGVSANVTGLQRGTTYHYRVLANDTTGPAEGADQTFTTLTTAVATGASSEVGQSSANVTGTVTPEGLETYYYYEYGPTSEYGQSTAPAGPGVKVGAGLSPVLAPATLVPLTPGTIYHYRLVAWNEAGASYGQDEMFTTEAGRSPSVSTGSASGVSVNGATISGTIDPAGAETSYRFEYGTSTESGTQAFGTVLAQQGVQTVTLSLQGLAAGTTYHYRLVVSNPGGEAEGLDATFTTPAISDPLVNPETPPLVGSPNIAFPKEEKGSGTSTTPKALTKAEKLKKALKACHAKKGKKRASCEAAAHRKYGPTKRKTTKKR